VTHGFQSGKIKRASRRESGGLHALFGSSLFSSIQSSGLAPFSGSSLFIIAGRGESLRPTPKNPAHQHIQLGGAPSLSIEICLVLGQSSKEGGVFPPIT
jgi:hypothetical protein